MLIEYRVYSYPWQDLMLVKHGVGFAAAKALASASNIFQVILASRSLSKGSTVKAEIEAGGIKDKVSVSKAVVHVQQFGRLGVPINDAGLLGTMEDNIKTRNPNSLSVSCGQGTLVRNTARNVSADWNIRNGDGYVASKAALNILVALEHAEFGEKRLKVFAASLWCVRSNLRGESEQARSGWRGVGDAEVAGELVLSIVEGKWDADVGCLVYKDGIYAW
ncbi:uncharacterized protein K444DRAFT_644992 [Hyaloscypha bicolor E]|uniref:NAD(P)-binding protein n=1 Tax=Hyaloscypha bicolor E TaxID=1095630 RepID=A0A2J6SZE6_9HELO|nr:uncharacterized protein K444DRAFT_644992 [Hyaloscypha bicolor E]PMD56160.1 hypothetical protein K444DRAFT_644992 [Hyaloscypha bicolor E]